MDIKTKRLIIKPFSLDMAYAIHIQSLDEKTRLFLPDEVFETEQEAKDTVSYLMGQYQSLEGPWVYPICLNSNEVIGYVQLIKIDTGYEVGYHIGETYRGFGYASEALKAFVLYIYKEKGISTFNGICLVENKASIRVLEKCGFRKVSQGIGKYQGQLKEVCHYVLNCDTINIA